jgi:DNA-binding GntR family transcriptional regulator
VPRIPARTQDLSSEAYQQLRELIVSGQLAPGSRIIESEVADRLSISRTPVRSALARLMQEGYVVPGGGRQNRLSVTALTVDDAREIFEIVGEIEGLAARRAAMLPVREREAVAAELTVLDRALVERAREDPPDTREIFRLFTRFHRTYVEAGAGPRLRALHDAIKPQADRYRRLYSTTQVSRIQHSVQEHVDIIGGIQRGEPDLAQRAVQVNWRNAAGRLSAVIERLGEIGSW